MLKNTKRFFVFQDSSIPDVYGDICLYVCDHQTAYIAYWHLYWVKKMKQYCLNFHALGQHWWERPYNVLNARIERVRLELITQSVCVAYSLLPAKPYWWQVSLDNRDSSKIFKQGKFRLKRRNTHVQLTTWYGNDINMMKSHFNLLQISI